MVKKTTSYSFIHLIAILLTPVIFACAHATTEETLDGYGGTANLNPEVEQIALGETALLEPPVVSNFSLSPSVAEPTSTQVAAAQQSVVKNAKTHRATSPFEGPKKVAKRAQVKKSPAPAIALVAPNPLVESPKTTVTRNGSTLNRYYFVRKGDTAELLSKVFYGDANRAAEIVEWNGPAESWKPGDVVYFRSGQNPDDTSLLSYYFEAGVATEEVTLESGQNLMLLAEKRYGSPDSWREIAVLNGLRKGAGPEVGQSLKLYPTAFAKEDVIPLVAQMDPKVEREPKMASTQIASFIQHNPLIVACTIVALILLGGFLFMQRKRYRSRFDF